jgi:hypothetical protein
LPSETAIGDADPNSRSAEDSSHAIDLSRTQLLVAVLDNMRRMLGNSFSATKDDGLAKALAQLESVL